MGSFLSNIFSGSDKPKEPVPTQMEPGVALTNDEVKLKSLKNDTNDDFKLALSLYKKYKPDGYLDVLPLVKRINPDATDQQCPYCKVIHDFKASRARKCPQCFEKMVVRQGLFVTESQAIEIEKLIQKAYEQQGLITRVGYLLESVQNAKIDKKQTELKENLAEVFRFLAQIENQKDPNGFSFWDKAWGYYNEARMEAMKELKDKYMIQFSNLPIISWNMAQMLLDQANFESNNDRSSKVKRRALIQAYISLAESAKLGVDLYLKSDVYSFIKKLTLVMNFSDSESKGIQEQAQTSMRLDTASIPQYRTLLKELNDYEVIS